MKKNKMMRLASTLLVLCLMSTCVISGTFAKYVSTAKGSDEARVALWSFTVGGSQIASTSETSITFDLFKTINDSGNTDTETDVTGYKVIAPGTAGSFEIVLKNESEVTAMYAIDYTTTNTSDIPIEFSVDGKNWVSELADVTAKATGDGNTALAVGSEAKAIKVEWRWAYEADDTGDTDGDGMTNGDEIDTALGINGNAVITVEAKITATQVD